MKCERKEKKMKKTGKWEKDPVSSDIDYDCRECGARMEDTSN